MHFHWLIGACALQQALAFSFVPCRLAPSPTSQLAQTCGTFRSTVHFRQRVRAQQQADKTEGSLVDKVAAKGIWQGGELPSEAQEALQRVGWIDGQTVEDNGMPSFTREDIGFLVEQAVAAEEFADERSKEMFQEDTREKLVKELLRREIKAELGMELEDLLNPIKVVNLEKKILASTAKMASASPQEREALKIEIDGYKQTLTQERRNVMMDGLRLVFRGQALLSILIGGALAFDKMPFYPDVPIAARAFGFWTMWLFTIPSLRAVKPLGYPRFNISPTQEKKALNLAFVLTPLTTIALPFATQDPSIIFAINAAVVAATVRVRVRMSAVRRSAGRLRSRVRAPPRPCPASSRARRARRQRRC